MQRHICALQLSRLCGSHRNLPEVHLKALVTAFSLHYQHGYQSYGTNLLPTDLGPSDPYALLAAHVMYDLAMAQNSAEPIIVALVLLEWLLKKSPSNFHAKLLCVRLYHTVGEFSWFSLWIAQLWRFSKQKPVIFLPPLQKSTKKWSVTLKFSFLFTSRLNIVHNNLFSFCLPL